MNRLRKIWADTSPHIIVAALAFVLVVAYFTGIPGVNDNIDPVFHLLHNLYSAMWSNMWAPSVWTLLGFVIADVRHERRTRQLHTVHNDRVTDLAGQIEDLSARLIALIGASDDSSKLSGQDRADPH